MLTVVASGPWEATLCVFGERVGDTEVGTTFCIKASFDSLTTCTYTLDNHKTKFKIIATQEQKVLEFLAVFVNKYKSHVHIT